MIASNVPLFVVIIIVLFVAAIVIGIYGFWPPKKGEKDEQSATQIHDMEMGEHISKIKEILTIWRRQLIQSRKHFWVL